MRPSADADSEEGESPARATRRQARVFTALFVASLFLYVPRVGRSLVLAGDSAELVTAAATWGVPHPPGYALYTLVAHAFTWLPGLELPFSVHLASAIAHAAAVGLVGSAIDVVTGSLAGALIGASTLALGRVFFLGSLYAEVFPLNDALFALLLWLALRLARANAPSEAAWRAMAIALGFGLAHHPMMVLALPTLALVVARPLADHVRRRPRAAIELGMLALIPAVASASLLYAAASRHPYLSWGNAVDLRSLLELVTRQDYGGPFRASRRLAEGQLLERLDTWGAATASSFGVTGTFLALLGALAAVAPGNRRVGLALVVAPLVSGPIFAAANAVDIHSTYRIAFFERFLGMSHVAVALLAGIGTAWLWNHLRFNAGTTRRVPAAIGAALLTALTLGPLVPSALRLDMSQSRLGIAYAHDLVLSTPDGALLLLKGDMSSQAALYVCAVERRCGDRIVLSPGQLFMPWKQRELARRYPNLALPPENAASIPVRSLVEQELGRRAVFVHADLLDDAVLAPNAAVPAGLLFRVYTSEEAVQSDLATIRHDLQTLESGWRCDGCFERRDTLPIDEQLVRAYDDALRAHVVAAGQLGLDAEGAALRARAHL